MSSGRPDVRGEGPVHALHGRPVPLRPAAGERTRRPDHLLRAHARHPQRVSDDVPARGVSRAAEAARHVHHPARRPQLPGAERLDVHQQTDGRHRAHLGRRHGN